MKALWWIGGSLALFPPILMVAGIALLVRHEVDAAHNCTPPTGMMDIDSFRHWRPEITQFTMITNSGGEHLIAYGSLCGTLASGPSAYVFDRSGRLVDLSLDIGDDPSFDQRWRAQRSRSSRAIIPAAEISDWMFSDF